jgi:cysteine desulfuration protein SufE
MEQITLSFEEKIDILQKKFSTRTDEEKYSLLIDLGRNLPPLEDKTHAILVSGCQSRLYLRAEYHEERVFFFAEADALISQGLAALLIEVYGGETPLTIMTHPPHFLKTLGIFASLSPHRAQGLLNIYLTMRKLCL